jgi:hypothetical protein
MATRAKGNKRKESLHEKIEIRDQILAEARPLMDNLQDTVDQLRVTLNAYEVGE